MSEYYVAQPAAGSWPKERVRIRKRRLRVPVLDDSFKAAFVNFSNSAEAFATSLQDSLNRQFASKYVSYLQDISRGLERVRPCVNGRPNCRLISAELERIFSISFFETT